MFASLSWSGLSEVVAVSAARRDWPASSLGLGWAQQARVAQTPCGQCGPCRVWPFPDGLMGAAAAFHGAVLSLATRLHLQRWAPGFWPGRVENSFARSGVFE